MGTSSKSSTEAEHLVREHWRAVFSLCLAHALCLSDAEDALQETFTRAIAGLDSLREPAKARAWLFGIARRVCADQGRKRHSVESLPDHVASKRQPTDERVEELLAALSRLPEPYREVVSLYYLDGQSTICLAGNLGLTPAAARQRLARARVMLHQLMTRGKI